MFAPRYFGPRFFAPRYWAPDFQVIVVAEQRGGDSSGKGLDSSLDALLVREDEEILAIIMMIGRRK